MNRFESINIENVARRSFVSRVTSGIAAFGLFGGAPRAAEAQLVWKASEWKLAEFRKLVNEPARVKQVFDVVQIGDGTALNSVKNSLNGLRFGFGIPEHQIKIVAGLHGAANMLNYDDYVWDKHQIGEWLNVTDPATGRTSSTMTKVGWRKSLPPKIQTIGIPSIRTRACKSCKRGACSF